MLETELRKAREELSRAPAEEARAMVEAEVRRAREQFSQSSTGQQRAEITPSAAVSAFATPATTQHGSQSTPILVEGPENTARNSGARVDVAPPAPLRIPSDPAWRVVRTPSEDFMVYYGTKEHLVPLGIARNAANVLSFLRRQGNSKASLHFFM